MQAAARIDDILRFWFGDADPAAAIGQRPQWFTKDAGFDRATEDGFGIEIEMALAGGLREWHDSPAGTLALILLLDQFTRNVFRGTAKAFAGDTRALALARQAVASGQDRAMGIYQRLFVYLPFEHCEDMACQDASVSLIGALGDAELTRYAERHRAIIIRFGRYPHRNAVLGRQSTIAELQFLAEPGSSF